MSPFCFVFPAYIPPYHLGGNASAVVRNGNFQDIIFWFPCLNPYHTIFRAFQPVENRIFHNGLKNHFWYQATLKILWKIHFKPAPSGQANGLDFHIAMQNFHLAFERNKFIGRNTKAKNVRQIGGHNRRLRHLIDLANPFYGIQGIAEKMEIELGLEHPNLSLVQFPLVFQQLLLVLFQGDYHSVEMLRKLAKLIVLIMGNMYIQIVMNDLSDCPVELLDTIRFQLYGGFEFQETLEA